MKSNIIYSICSPIFSSCPLEQKSSVFGLFMSYILSAKRITLTVLYFIWIKHWFTTNEMVKDCIRILKYSWKVYSVKICNSLRLRIYTWQTQHLHIRILILKVWSVTIIFTKYFRFFTSNNEFVFILWFLNLICKRQK
jgi:hypothetical protein